LDHPELIQRLITLPEGMVGNFHQMEGKDAELWFCCADPPGRRAGSGGGTAHILSEAYAASEAGGGFREWLSSGKRMIIHAGGESRRLPAYAPSGKSLLPLPVFRWSKGQYLDQKLLDFQAGYYQQILKNAPESYCTLIGSGDVMFISSDRFRGIPEADVLVFGIWVEDETASRHGVFFSPRDNPGELAFVRQKPGMQELRDLSQDYYYLMDSGIVLMNTAATMKLMQKSGWIDGEERFRDGIPGFYDLYGEMLASFGTGSDSPDPDLEDLTVKLVPLHHGEFYHFGSNSDLIQSSLRLQNRITDQRLRFTREADHHPSIFQQNARVRITFTDENHHIWIENSSIPSSWLLKDHHVLTGIPENDWTLEVRSHTCIDVVPLSGGRYATRVYGFGDRFGKGPGIGETWLGRTLGQWLQERSLTAEEAGIDPSASLFDMPLFPVTELEEIPGMISFMMNGAGASRTDAEGASRTDGEGSFTTGGDGASTMDGDMPSNRWRECERLSAGELLAGADMVKLFDQRRQLKQQSLPRLAANHHRSIFYFLDLERAAEDYRRAGIPLPGELTEDEPVIKRINDSMFRSRVAGDNPEGARHERKAFRILQEAMITTLEPEPVMPVRNVLDDQILWGRSPVRFDLAGGWTDTPPYCIMEGGSVVNMAVELNGQLPLQVYARPIERHVIVLRSIDLGEKLEIDTFEELERHNRTGDGFAIPRAALVLAGFSNRFSAKRFPDLASRLKDFGCGIELSLLAAIPKGSGLGTSSNLAATVLGTLADFCGLTWDRHQIAYRTLILEQMLTTGGGWQDQYGGIFQGVKLLETDPGIRQFPNIKWLPDQLFTGHETRDMMLLYYTGVTRIARDILGEIVKAMFLNSSAHLSIFSEMRHHARETFDTLLRNDYEGLAEKIAISWDLNQRLDEGTNPPVIRSIIGRVDDLLLGYKLLGAGGGGYLLMLAKSTEAAVRVKSQLEKDPPNSRARFVDFSVSRSGFQVSRS